MSPVRIRDNSRRDKEDFRSIPALTEKLADQTLGQLEREGVFVFPNVLSDAEDMTQEQMVLQSVNNTYCTGNVMGFLGCGEEKLMIESRFGGDEEDFLLQYLLEKVLKTPNFVHFTSHTSPENRWFQFFLFLFPHYLKSAVRKGLFKTYIRHEYNDSNVKGTINIPRHIAKNTPFLGKVAYSQREFSYDNSLMQLVRHTVEFLGSKPYGQKLLFGVRDEVQLVTEATPGYRLHDRQKIVEQNRNAPVCHAYFKEYLDLQKLCLVILQQEKHRVGFGSRQIYGILFDGAWLWEEYIYSLVEEVFYHPKNKSGQGAQQLFSGNVGRIYPDFISRSSERRLIADAKYKPMQNIGSRDYLQVLAYMFRFDAKVGYYFYPESGSTPDRKLWLNQGLTYEENVMPRDNIFVMKHGLKIPANATSYADFTAKMKASEQEFVSVFFHADVLKTAEQT